MKGLLPLELRVDRVALVALTLTDPPVRITTGQTMSDQVAAQCGVDVWVVLVNPMPDVVVALAVKPMRSYEVRPDDDMSV